MSQPVPNYCPACVHKHQYYGLPMGCEECSSGMTDAESVMITVDALNYSYNQFEYFKGFSGVSDVMGVLLDEIYRLKKRHGLE